MRPSTEKAVIGYLSGSDVKADYMESMLYLTLYDMAGPQRLIGGGGVLPIRAGANLSGPRNDMVRKFLKHGTADWLLIVDSDMVFTPDLLERLIEHADPVEAPIVGALAFGFDENGEVQPTLYGFAGDDDNPKVVRYHEWPPEAMMQVAATGTGTLLVHRSVFERMASFAHPSRPGKLGFNDAFPWFQELEHEGRPVGEDIGFCWRAGLMGIPVFVNTNVQVGHIKDRVLTMDAYLAERGYLSPLHPKASIS